MSRPRPVLAVLASITLLLAVLSTTVAVNQEAAGPVHAAAGAAALASEPIGHLVVSEVMTGGASASDELIELYNPSAVGAAARRPGGDLRHGHRRHHHAQGIVGGRRRVAAVRCPPADRERRRARSRASPT